MERLSSTSQIFEGKFLETNDIQDLEEAIGHHRAALALRPEGHPDRHWSLSQLGWCLDVDW